MKDNTIVIIRSSFSLHGGVEKVVLDVIDALLKNETEVTLLTWAPKAWPLSHPRLHIIPAGISKGPRFLQALLFNRSVMRYLKSHQSPCIFSFDKVTQFTHLHGGGGTHRSFLRLKNADSGFISRQFRRLSLFHRYTLFVEQQGFRNPMLKKIQCASSLVKTDIVQDYRVPQKKMELIPNGIDWSAIGNVFGNRRDLASSLIDHHHLAPNQRYLLFLGSGFERKGLDIAIHGLSGLPENYSLLVVGKGRIHAYQSLTERLACGRRVHFLGPQPEGWKYAALCCALVLPSRYEPFGIVCAEANAMGIPVLISDRTGYADWVEEGRNGVIAKFPVNPESIADSFARLLAMIESPSLSAGEIREGSRRLDHSSVMKRLVHDFLGV